MWEKGHYANKCPQKVTLLEQINSLDIGDNLKFKMMNMLSEESEFEISYNSESSYSSYIDKLELNFDCKNDINYLKAIIQANGLEEPYGMFPITQNQ